MGKTHFSTITPIKAEKKMNGGRARALGFYYFIDLAYTF